MRASRKLLPILLVVIVAAFIAAACSGGAAGQERTWFNFPSTPLDIKPDGSASVYGLPIGAVLPPSLVQQLQGANVQKLEARVGANGIHVLANGQDLPFLAWDSSSAGNLKNTLSALGIPGVNNIDLLRSIGLGAALKLPVGQGQTALDVPRWHGETTVTPSTATQGQPVNLGLSFDQNGQLSALGLSPQALSAIAGPSLPSLDANTMALINRLGWQKMSLQSTPNGLKVTVNDNQPLATIAYDDASLNALLGILKPILGATNPNLAATLEQVIPQLPGLNLNATVGFNGTPVESKLSELPVGIADNGNITFAGLPIPGAAIPPATLEQLKSAGIQNVGVAATPDSILLAVNGKSLPKISFTTEGLNTVATLASGLAGVPPQMITGGLQAMSSAGLSTSIALPGAQPAPAPTEPTFAAPASDQPAPTIKLNAAITGDQITSIAGLDADQMQSLGISLPTLPANVVTMLKGLNAKQINLVNTPGKLTVNLDGKDAINMQYDEASLRTAWDLAKPQLADSPLADPALQKLIEEQVLPLLPTTNLNVAVTLQ